MQALKCRHMNTENDKIFDASLLMIRRNNRNNTTNLMLLINAFKVAKNNEIYKHLDTDQRNTENDDIDTVCVALQWCWFCRHLHHQIRSENNYQIQ